MNQPFLRTLLCFLLLIPFSPGLFAANGAISGHVTDASGGAVDRAKVTAENVTTGLRSSVETSQGGLYVFPVLPSGQYRLTVQKAGFHELRKESVNLSVSGATTVDVTLEIGAISQTVTVTSANSPLERESAGVSTVIDRGMVENMPLNGRSFHTLMRLAPGVNIASSSVVSTGQFVVNGMRNNSNYFMVDGVGANFAASPSATFTQQASGSLPGLTVMGGFNSLVTADALEEFRISTSGYAAEYGRTPGGQIEMRTRSGTNDLHGSVSHYFRNDVLDANDWFANANRQGRPPMRLNQPAVAVGGPVFIPKFYDGRNRTFFHFSFEALRLMQPRFLDAVTPTAEARQMAIPALQPILNAFPLPNADPLPTDPLYTGRYRKNISFPNKHDIPALRIDQYLGENTQLFGRWSDAPSSFVSRSRANSLSENYSDNRMITIGLNRTFSPRIVNEFRVNYSSSEAGFNWDLAEVDGAVRPDYAALYPSYAGMENASIGFNLGPAASSPGISVGRAIGNYQRQLNFVNQLSIIAGNHQLKMGLDIRRMMPQPRFRAYGISHQFTPDFATAITKGLNTTSVQLLAPPGNVTMDNYSFFVQDAWRINRRLTLTLGLRWEIIPAPQPEKERPLYRISQVDDLMTATIAPAGLPLFETRYRDFAPRFGVAYQPFANSDLTIRGGAGIFYDLPTGQALAAFNYWPYNTVRYTYQNSFPAPAETLQPIPVSVEPPYDDDFRFYDPNMRLPYAWQWNFGIEKSLGNDQSFSLNYVGSSGHRLIFPEFYRNSPGNPETGTPAHMVINPIFTESYVRIHKNFASSNYNSLQAQFQRRMSRGIQVMANYTFSKSLDNLSDETATASPSQVLSPDYFYGPSDFDIRHNVNVATSVTLPFTSQNAFLRGLVGGWGVDGIFSVRSGAPVSVIVGDDPLNIGLTSYVRPNYTGQPLYLYDQQYPGGKILNPAAFLKPEAGTLGDLGRNVARAHPLRQLDIAVRRDFRIFEGVKLQFRGEAFNVTNTANFGGMSGNLTSGTFGRSTAMLGRALGTGGTNGGFNPIFQIGGPRSLQFSLRLTF